MPKYTTKEIIEQFQEARGYTFDYSLVDYVHSQTKVKIICRIHGVFEQLVNMHRKGQGCAKCMYDDKRSSASDVIVKFKEVHGERYDYSLVDYKNVDKKVTIKCAEHGEFKQTPYHHTSGNGCPKCIGRHRSKEDMIELFTQTHGNRYNYSKVDFFRVNDKVDIVCQEHGVFSQSAARHILGQGCIKCSGHYQHTTDEMIGRFTEVHGDLYDYSFVDYIGSDTKIKIVCGKHGVFDQMPYSHMSGNGCPDCAVPSGYSKSQYIECCKNTNGNAYLYLINCQNDGENFYKVGISKNGALERFKTKSKLPYDFEVIKEIYGSAALIWDLEKSIHSIMSNFKYKPNIDFGGKTECFSKVPEQVVKLLRNFNESEQLMFLV